MLSKKEQDLIEKVVSGGGATGQSMTADATGTTAQAPGNSKKQGDSMPKSQNPAGTGIEETDPENNVKATADTSAQNKASVAMKGSAVKEELSGVFGDDLTEEMLEKAATLFEAALAIKVAELEEAYAKALDEEVESIHTELTEQVDQYLSFVASEWLAENTVAVESSLKNELTEEFLDGLKNLFAEHYIDVPSDKVDVLESLALKVEELETRLNEEMGSKIELVNELNRHAMKEAFAEVSEGLVLTQVEKFRTIAENLEFTGDVDSYTTKLKTIRENYFSGKKSATSNILTEEFEGDDSSAAPAVHGEMSKYVTAISRTLKK
jgi:hypothetical protein